MLAFSSASCFLISFLICSSEAQTNITAELGQEDVILPCKAPNKNKTITVVEWIRPEMKTDHVLLYRDGHFHSYNQHPSYQNRVDLKDKEMKDGNVSLILKNVKMEDTGIYECYVDLGGTNRRKRSGPEPINIIILEVGPSGYKGGLTGDAGETDGGNKDGGDMVGVIVGPVVGVILLLAVLSSAGFLTYRRCMKKNPNLPVPPDEPAAEQML